MKIRPIVVYWKQIDYNFTPAAGEYNEVSFSFRTKLSLTIFLQYWHSASFAIRKARWLIIRAILNSVAVAKIFIEKKKAVLLRQVEFFSK